MQKRSATALALLCQGVWAAAQGQAQPSTVKRNKDFIVDRNRVVAFDTATEPIGPYVSSISQGSEHVRWTQPIVAPAVVRTMSVHLKIGGTRDASKWELRFRSFRALNDVITSDSPRGRAADAWSDDIPGNVVVVELVADVPPKGLEIVIDSYDHPIKRAVPQGLFANRMLGILAATEDVKKLGTPVARLRIKTNHGQAMCTGFLISESLMLTNFHCISTDSEAANARADFGFDRGGAALKTFRLEKLEVINSDTTFDYVVARVSKSPGKIYDHIATTSVDLVSFQGLSRQLLLIEHPAGGPKMVSIQGCVVVNDKVPGVDPQTPSDFGHHCDTLGGSSGSPVFDRDTKKLVGLHHAGYPEGAKPDDSLENQAVYIGFILKDIKKQSPAIYAEILPGSH
jgi:hypothetical protein